MLARSALGIGVRGRPAKTLQYYRVSRTPPRSSNLSALALLDFQWELSFLCFYFENSSHRQKKSSRYPRSFHLCALANALPAHLVRLSVPLPTHPSLLRDIVDISSAKHPVSSAGHSSQNFQNCWKGKWDRVVGLWKVFFFFLWLA